MFADRSESAMTVLLDAVCEKVYEGFADLDTFGKYTVKNQIMPLMAACIDVLDAEPHKAKRGDEVEAWIKRHRDEEFPQEAAWHLLDDLLDDYRLHADEGTPLTSDADEMGG